MKVLWTSLADRGVDVHEWPSGQEDGQTYMFLRASLMGIGGAESYLGALERSYDLTAGRSSRYSYVDLFAGKWTATEQHHSCMQTVCLAACLLGLCPIRNLTLLHSPPKLKYKGSSQRSKKNNPCFMGKKIILLTKG